jgi:MFS family permease
VRQRAHAALQGAGPTPAETWPSGFAVSLALCMGAGPLLISGMTAMGPLVISDLGLSQVHFGAFATAAFATATLSSALSGHLVDRHGARAAVVVLYIASAGALVIAAFARTYLVTLAAVALSGFAQSLSNPATNRLISARPASSRRGLLVGIKQSGVQVVQFATGLVLPSLALIVGWRGALGLSAGFVAFGLLLTLRYLPRRAVVPLPVPTQAARAPLPRGVWRLSAVAMLTGTALQASNVYLPLYGYEELGLPVVTAGLVAGVVGAMGFSSRITWGYLVGRIEGSPRWPLIGLALAAAAGTSGFYLAGRLGSVPLLWSGAVVFGTSGVAINVVLMVTVLRLVPQPAIGRASGILAFGMYLGFVIGPVSFGGLIDATDSYGPGWLAAAGAYVCAAALFARRPSTTTIGGPVTDAA